MWIPQPGPGGGGYPCQGGTPPRVTDGVLDTPQSVCLLRSRRRTFLFTYSFSEFVGSVIRIGENYFVSIS